MPPRTCCRSAPASPLPLSCGASFRISNTPRRPSISNTPRRPSLPPRTCCRLVCVCGAGCVCGRGGVSCGWAGRVPCAARPRPPPPLLPPLASPPRCDWERLREPRGPCRLLERGPARAAPPLWGGGGGASPALGQRAAKLHPTHTARGLWRNPQTTPFTPRPRPRPRAGPAVLGPTPEAPGPRPRRLFRGRQRF